MNKGAPWLIETIWLGIVSATAIGTWVWYVEHFRKTKKPPEVG